MRTTAPIFLALSLLAVSLLAVSLLAQPPVANRPGVANGPSVIVWEFTTADCTFCKALAPDVDRLVRAGYPIEIIRCDTPRAAQLQAQLGITHVPTFVAMTATLDGSGDRLATARMPLTTPQALEAFLRAQRVFPNPK